EDEEDPTQAFLTEAQRYDLIMLGATTRFEHPAQFWPDEILTTLVTKGSRPVVIAPPLMSTGENVVVAYDGSPQAAKALQLFVSLGLTQLGPVHVLGIDCNAKHGARTVDRAVEFLRLHGVKA